MPRTYGTWRLHLYGLRPRVPIEFIDDVAYVARQQFRFADPIGRTVGLLALKCVVAE